MINATTAPAPPFFTQLASPSTMPKTPNLMPLLPIVAHTTHSNILARPTTIVYASNLLPNCLWWLFWKSLVTRPINRPSPPHLFHPPTLKLPLLPLFSLSVFVLGRFPKNFRTLCLLLLCTTVSHNACHHPKLTTTHIYHSFYASPLLLVVSLEFLYSLALKSMVLLCSATNRQEPHLSSY